MAGYHYNDVTIDAIASQITSLTIVYPAVYSDADQRKHQSFASLAFVRGIHRWPVNSPHKWPVTRKKFPFDDVIMSLSWTVRFMVYVLKWRVVIIMTSSLHILCLKMTAYRYNDQFALCFMSWNGRLSLSKQVRFIFYVLKWRVIIIETSSRCVLCLKMADYHYDIQPLHVLCLNPLRAKFFRGTKTYIYILCHYSILIWHRYLKSFLK